MLRRSVLVLCRDVVIDMLCGSGPNAKLKKAEILEGAKRKLSR